MAKDSQRPPPTYRDVSPCMGCEEKFLACHDRCPKDLRGEFGYKAWLADLDKVKAARKDFIRSISIRKYWRK